MTPEQQTKERAALLEILLAYDEALACDQNINMISEVE